MQPLYNGIRGQGGGWIGGPFLTPIATERSSHGGGHNPPTMTAGEGQLRPGPPAALSVGTSYGIVGWDATRYCVGVRGTN